jgi:glycosyltransferase involved in cell wall biosynthesis
LKKEREELIALFSPQNATLSSSREYFEMQILHASHISNFTPPTGYGGIELVVDTLAREQVAKGHEVLVLGVKSHYVKAPYKMRPVFDEPVKDVRFKHKVRYSWQLLRDSRNVEVVHIHVQWLTPIASLLKRFGKKAVLLTLHADPSKAVARLGVPMVAISKTQRRRLENCGIKVATMIYNGIDVEKYPFRSEKEDFFAYLGRIDETKGLHVAIEVMRRCHEKLVIMGPITDIDYFNNFVRPFIDDKEIIYLGEVDFETKVEYLSRARALLYPVQYEEFFGIAMIEALATGTPVIGFARGSVVEVVKDGITGFIVKSPDEMVQAMKAADELDRKECRMDVEERFSSKAMAEHYDELYQYLLSRE